MIGDHHLVIVFYALFLGIGFFASLYDFIFYKIPNTLLACAFFLLILKLLLDFREGAFLEPALIFIALLSAGFALYVANIFGAGDAKFLAVSGAWMTDFSLSTYLILAGILAGIISLLYVFASLQIETLRKKLWSHMIGLHREHPKWFRFLENRLQKPFIPNAATKTSLRQVPIPFGIPMFVASLIIVTRMMWS